MSGRHTQARYEFNLRKKMTPHDIADMFNDFAEDYEQVYLNIGWRLYEVVGDFMAKIVPEENRSKLKILDVAAGTGFLGNEKFGGIFDGPGIVSVSVRIINGDLESSPIEKWGMSPDFRVKPKLKNHGFTHVDALDPAEKMLSMAKRRNIYRTYYCAFINKDRNDAIETDHYDHIVASGAFNEGLVPCDAFQEMIRIVKPGGRITFTVRWKFVNSSDNLRDRLLPLIDQLAQEGVWEVTSVALADGKSSTDGPGTLFSLKVLVSEKKF